MPLVPFQVSARGEGVAQTITVAGDDPHVFRADTYPAFGGADADPSPLAYTLGALTSCNQITAQLVAKDLGITLGEFELSARGDLDPSVFVGGAEGNPSFTAVVVEGTVTTDAEGERFEQLVSETERRCPVTQMFKRSGVDFSSTWKPLPLA